MSATYMIGGTYIVIVSRISERIMLPTSKQLSRVVVGTLIYELDRPCGMLSCSVVEAKVEGLATVNALFFWAVHCERPHTRLHRAG